MLVNESKETPWWAWIVAVAVIVLSVMFVPDDVSYQAQMLQLEHE